MRQPVALPNSLYSGVHWAVANLKGREHRLVWGLPTLEPSSLSEFIPGNTVANTREEIYSPSVSL